MLIDEAHDLLVDLSPQHHFHHVHGLAVGDAHPLDEFAFLSDSFQEFVDVRPSSVHHHRVHADELQQHHVASKAMLEGFLDHGVAAILDDDGLAVKALNVRQCFGEVASFLPCVGRIERHRCPAWMRSALFYT